MLGMVILGYSEGLRIGREICMMTGRADIMKSLIWLQKVFDVDGLCLMHQW